MFHYPHQITVVVSSSLLTHSTCITTSIPRNTSSPTIDTQYWSKRDCSLRWFCISRASLVCTSSILVKKSSLIYFRRVGWSATSSTVTLSLKWCSSISFDTFIITSRLSARLLKRSKQVVLPLPSSTMYFLLQKLLSQTSLWVSQQMLTLTGCISAVGLTLLYTPSDSSQPCSSSLMGWSAGIDSLKSVISSLSMQKLYYSCPEIGPFSFISLPYYLLSSLNVSYDC